VTTMEKLTRLFETCHQVYVETNPHHVNYEAVTRYVSSNMGMAHSPDDIVGEVEDGRTLFHVQVYPETPIGSYVRIGHDLDAVLDSILEAVSR
jgi:hypothetical protein